MPKQARTVVIFGAGATGRGHVGQLAHDSGYRLVFVDKDESLVRQLAARGRYTVRLMGTGARDVAVSGFSAYSLGEEEAVAEEVASCHLLLTAVLAENLPGVAPALSRGLARRAELGVPGPLNVIACENMIFASAALREHVLKALDPRYHDYVRAHVSFPNAMVARVVPAPTGDRLLLAAEDYNEWTVDRRAFLGDDPGLEGLELVDNLEARLERKLYLHNTGHAVCGYLAHLKGYELMCDAVVDAWIEPIVRGAMVESGQALVHKHGFSRESIVRYRESFFPRVASRLILDPVSRVIRSPIRKLGRRERLIGPACLALDYGIQPENLALGIAALLMYRSPEDGESQHLQGQLRSSGLATVLETIAGIDATAYRPLVELVEAGLKRLAAAA